MRGLAACRPFLSLAPATLLSTACCMCWFLGWAQQGLRQVLGGAELGVAGIHMYAIVADFVLKPSSYMHEPGSWRAVNFEHHHLVTWRAFHPTKWSAHYYGQVREL